MNLTDERILSMVRELIDESLPTPAQRGSGRHMLRYAAAYPDQIHVTEISPRRVKPKPGGFYQTGELSRRGDRSTMQQAANHTQNDRDDDNPYNKR